MLSGQSTGGRTIYEVLRNKSVPENGVNVMVEDCVDENNIAYGSQCLLLIKMIAADTSCNEMNGEIISPCFTRNDKAGTSRVRYIVKMTGDDGECS